LIEMINIKLLLPTKVVITLDLEHYLKFVVPAEMPALWPIEALKAMAIASRTYSYYATVSPRHDSLAHLCTSPVHCHAYNPDREHRRTNDAIAETEDLVVSYQNRPIIAIYHADCGGHTCNNESVFTKGAPRPYLRGVSCPSKLDKKRGHGVGFCQTGARVLAETGASFTEILQHYYTGTEVVPLSSLQK